mmetsp:Transcript_68601/g.146844  ORF Transcript_68601/g.146844 Transcript_68601/m.146844 type:complete len:207 (-) Transcript_68601:1258-1878(-)
MPTACSRCFAPRTRLASTPAPLGQLLSSRLWHLPSLRLCRVALALGTLRCVVGAVHWHLHRLRSLRPPGRHRARRLHGDGGAVLRHLSPRLSFSIFSAAAPSFRARWRRSGQCHAGGRLLRGEVAPQGGCSSAGQRPRVALRPRASLRWLLLPPRQGLPRQLRLRLQLGGVLLPSGHLGSGERTFGPRTCPRPCVPVPLVRRLHLA